MADPEWPSLEEMRALAARIPETIRFGASSWTYPGWRGLIYRRDYPATGRAARQLVEYAAWPLMRTVGIDSFFYRPPSTSTLGAYAAALPPGFRCVTKVWNRLTARTLHTPGTGTRHAPRNADWLNAPLFLSDVLAPMAEHFAAHLGPMVFEFQTIGSHDACSTTQFIDALDRFFGALPRGIPYAVEVRNPEFLTPAYFAVLRTHGVAHLFNAWTRMPSIGRQLALPDSITADFVVARALLRPGRTFANAVQAFAPYDRIREENPELRADLVALVRTALNLRIPAYVIVNNRSEGCSPLTIAAVAALLLGTSERVGPA